MYQNFEVKVKYEKTCNDGKTRIVSENYLVEGVSFADVEQTINKQLEPYITGEFMVDSIRRAKYTEKHLNSDGTKYFKAVLTFISVNEESGTEKRSKANFLIQANELADINNLVETIMHDSIANYEVSTVTETNLIDVIVLPEPTKEAE